MDGGGIHEGVDHPHVGLRPLFRREGLMNLETIVERLHLKVKSGEEMSKVEVRGGYVGDLLSDVMANSRKGDLLITRQVHQNIVAVASLNELAGIILVQGAEPTAETLTKAAREKIPLLVADMSAFEVAGRLFPMVDARGAPAT
jgi:hypothetical protein